jgi:O-succinylbenzoic acid--CoA ligase
VNSGGIKILIEKVERKIEELLNEFSLEKRFFVGSLADDFLGEKLILIIEDKQWTKTIETKFMESLRDKLPKYEVPKQVFFINKFIETETKKINRKKNIEIISKKL